MTNPANMKGPANFSATGTLRDGRAIRIRALRPQDRDAMLAAVARTGKQSLFRRFFGAKREFSDAEIRFFVNIDFVDHVAIIAEIDEDGTPAIIGGARFVKIDAGRAEVAFAVIDPYQGLGLGTLLMRDIAQLARSAGLHELVAEVLPENAPMLKVMEKSGLAMTTRRDANVVHVTLALA